MPEGYPGAAVGGGDVLDGETYSALTSSYSPSDAAAVSTHPGRGDGGGDARAPSSSLSSLSSTPLRPARSPAPTPSVSAFASR
jgi:hypothetical protein